MARFAHRFCPFSEISLQFLGTSMAIHDKNVLTTFTKQMTRNETNTKQINTKNKRKHFDKNRTYTKMQLGQTVTKTHDHTVPMNEFRIKNFFVHKHGLTEKKKNNIM